MGLHLHCMYVWSQQQVSNKINFSRPATNTEYLELEMLCASYLLKKIGLHTRRLFIVCAVNGCAVIAVNMLLPMIYAEEVNGCRYIVVSSYNFWEFALRTRVPRSVERVILRICSRIVAYTFSLLSFSKD